MGGNILLVDQLVALGVPRGSAVAALLLSLLGYYIAFASLTLLTLLLLWLHHHAITLLVGITTSFLIVAVTVPGLALWLRARGSRPLPPWIERLQPIANLIHILSEAPSYLLGDGSLIVRVTWRNGLVFLLDSLTLLVCLRALGEAAPVPTCFIALIIASIVATMSLVPLGLGTFEASCATMLSLLGIPLAVAIAATLLLRGFTLWLPLVPGFLSARHTLRPRIRQRGG